MCFFQWLIDHIPLCFPEWLRQKIETFILYVALCYYEIGAGLVIVFGVYWGTLISIPAVVSALLMPIVGDFWEAIGQPVYGVSVADDLGVQVVFVFVVVFDALVSSLEEYVLLRCGAFELDC
ncbi:hypothetical protein BJX62DRAFT_236480 [Aspergillus germanicus]